MNILHSESFSDSIDRPSILIIQNFWFGSNVTRTSSFNLLLKKRKHDKFDITWFTLCYSSIFSALSRSLREKCPSTEIFLVLIFPQSDWIRRDTEYRSVLSPNLENADQKKLHIWTLHVMVTITTRALWFLKSVPKFIPIIDIFFLFVVNHSVTLEFNEIVIHFSLARSILKLPYFLQIFFFVKKSFKIALFCEFSHGYQQLVCQYE